MGGHYLEVTAILRDYRDYTMISAGVFDDYLATYALEHKDAIISRNQKIVTENLAILKDWLEEEPLADAILPAKVSTSFVKLRIGQSIESFCKALLQEIGVLLVPGSRFDLEGYVRLGYCTDRETLVTALQKLSNFLYKNSSFS